MATARRVLTRTDMFFLVHVPALQSGPVERQLLERQMQAYTDKIRVLHMCQVRSMLISSGAVSQQPATTTQV